MTKLCADMDMLCDQSVDDLVHLYRDVLTRLLDQHCLFITVRRRRKKTTPWFDADCHDARRRARAAERRFRRRRLVPMSSAVPESLTVVCRSYYMMTYTGWTFLTELRSS